MPSLRSCHAFVIIIFFIYCTCRDVLLNNGGMGDINIDFKKCEQEPRRRCASPLFIVIVFFLFPFFLQISFFTVDIIIRSTGIPVRFSPYSILGFFLVFCFLGLPSLLLLPLLLVDAWLLRCFLRFFSFDILLLQDPSNTTGRLNHHTMKKLRLEKGLILTSGKMVLLDKLLPKLKSEGHKVGGV